jgi:hypothetical protein
MSSNACNRWQECIHMSNHKDGELANNMGMKTCLGRCRCARGVHTLTKECSAEQLPKCLEDEAVMCVEGRHIVQQRCCDGRPPDCHATVEGRCNGLPGREEKHILLRHCCEATWPVCGTCKATAKHLKCINREEEKVQKCAWSLVHAQSLLWGTCVVCSCPSDNLTTQSSCQRINLNL